MADSPKNKRSPYSCYDAELPIEAFGYPYQAIFEFVAATTRRCGNSEPLLEPGVARREAEEFLAQFEVLYPNESVLRLAIRGAAAYGLSWFDANLWAYAENYGLDEIITEDFEHRRLYGSVTAMNPFAIDQPAKDEPP